MISQRWKSMCFTLITSRDLLRFLVIHNEGRQLYHSLVMNRSIVTRRKIALSQERNCSSFRGDEEYSFPQVFISRKLSSFSLLLPKSQRRSKRKCALLCLPEDSFPAQILSCIAKMIRCKTSNLTLSAFALLIIKQERRD